MTACQAQEAGQQSTRGLHMSCDGGCRCGPGGRFGCRRHASPPRHADTSRSLHELPEHGLSRGGGFRKRYILVRLSGDAGSRIDARAGELEGTGERERKAGKTLCEILSGVSFTRLSDQNPIFGHVLTIVCRKAFEQRDKPESHVIMRSASRP